ncbi:MAG: hypothetical protein WB789_05720 [Thermoplasmata archaeon]
MRSLSPAEIRVVRTLLAGGYESEAEELRATGVPRSTFQAIRRLAFVSGWVRERYIPDPLALGFRTITFRLGQPFADRWAEALQMLKTRDTVVLWASSETMFAVEFSRGDVALPLAAGQGQPFRLGWSVSARLAPDGIPVYFDYEGAWARWALGAAPKAYPKGLGGGSRNGRKRAAVPDARFLSAMQELVLRPFEFGSAPPPRLSFSQGRVPRRLRRLIDSGAVSRRILPDLGEIPPVAGERIREIVFVTGLLRPGRSAGALFEETTRESRGVPFLFASDQERVFIAGLAPAPRSVRDGRRGMLETLGKYVEGVEVIRGPIQALVPVIDHRYDRVIVAS